MATIIINIAQYCLVFTSQFQTHIANAQVPLFTFTFSGLSLDIPHLLIVENMLTDAGYSKCRQ